MANKTTNYNLTKPLATENYDVGVQNGNMDLIDEALAPSITADTAPSTPAVNNPAKLSIWISWILNRIKAITGKANWWDTPSKTLEDLNTHLADYATFKDDTEIKLSDYNSYASSVDANGIYTVVDYKRADGTLYMKSTLSGGTSPSYTTDTWKFYDALGTTVIATKTWTMTYDTNSKITSKVVA